MAKLGSMGVSTPQLCLPVTMTPWTPKLSTEKVANKLVVDNAYTCICTWKGVIDVTNPQQTTVNVPEMETMSK